MKKRILSLLMAVCMVAALVPALLVSVTAAENAGFTTTFELGGENWPAYDDKEFLGFQGNWTVGCYIEGVYNEYDVFDSYQIISKGGGTWSTTGLYLSGGFNTLLDPAPYYSVDEEGKVVGTTSAYAVTYTSRYEGTVDLDFVNVAPYPVDWTTAVPEGEDAALYVAILINDEMIWPTAGGSVIDPEDFALIDEVTGFTGRDDLDMLENVEIGIGDRISFVAARYNTVLSYVYPSITFHDGYEIVPSRLEQKFTPTSKDWPATRKPTGIGDLIQVSSRWTMGTYNPADKTFVEHEAQGRNGLDIWTGATRETTSTTMSSSKNGGIVLQSAYDLMGAYLFGTEDTANGVYPAYQAVSGAVATAEVSVSKLFIADVNQAAMKNATAYVDVYLNDTKVGTITVRTDDAGVATADKTISGLAVNKGDVFTFAASAAAGIKTLTALPVVTYTGISSFMTNPTTEKYALALEGSAVVVGDSVGMEFQAYATIDTYKDATAANLYVWDASITDKTLSNASAVVPLEVNDDFAYTAVYNGFAPKEMVDEISAQVVVLKDDQKLAESPISTFTVAETVQAQFDASYSAEERELLAAVLNYGAYAQKYFNYKTDNLANKDLDPSYAGIDADDYLYYAKFDGKKIGSLISASEIEAFSLCLENSVAIRLYINLDEYEKENCGIIVQHGETEDECIEDREGIPVDLATGTALFEGISLSDLSTVYHLRLAVQDGRYRYYGYTYTYSVESFAARMMDSTEANLPELLCAMMELGKLVA